MYFLIFISIVITVSYAQDCKVGGQRCGDHEQCCGGCCFNGYCIDTYRSCLIKLDVCKDHICMGDENCVVFQPPQCLGCEPIPLCRLPSEL